MAADALEIARRFLEWPAGRPGFAALLIDDLAERADILRSVPQTFELVDFHTDVRRLLPRHIEPDVAIFDCEAHRRTEWLEGGTFPHVQRDITTGPLKLIRTRTGWKVADYSTNGRPVRATFRVYRIAAIARGDYAISPRLLQIYPDAVTLVVDFRNAAPSPAELVEGALMVRGFAHRRTKRAYLRGSRRAEPGQTVSLSATWAVQPERVPTPLRFEFVAGSPSTGPVDIAFTLLAPGE